MKVRKILALLLAVVAVAALFAGCKAGKDIPTIEFWWTDNGISSGGASGKVKLVEDQINRICEENLGIHVHMTWVTAASYGTQLALAIANKETVDVAVYQFYGVNSFVTQFSNGQMTPLNDLLDAHGKDLKEMFGDILKGSTVDGKVYGIPTYRVLNTNMYWCVRKDDLQEAGVLEAAENVQTWADMEAVFEALKGLNKPNNYPLGGNKYITHGNGYVVGGMGSDNIYDSTWAFDNLGDTLGFIWSDQDGNVDNVFTHPGSVESFKRHADWLEKGYIFPESAYTDESAEVLLAQDVFTSYFVTSEYGVETTKTQQVGTEMLCLNMSAREGHQGLLGTDGARRLGCYIPVTSGEPELAMKFINFMYTSKELMNTLIWGVEGETYVVNDKGEACYPEGTDTTTCGYHSYDFMLGNAFLDLPWEGQGSDFRERALENFKAAPLSRYMGLSADTSNAAAIVAALSAVREEFRGQIDCGYYTDALFDEFVKKTDAAGFQEYLAIFREAASEF